MMTKPTSEQVTFLAAGAGATQRTALDKFRDVVSVKDFGAVGDGVADDSAAVAACLNASSGRIVDGGGFTYKCNSTISCTAQNLCVQNMTLDFSGVADQPGSPDRILTFAGSQASSTSLSSDALAGAFTIAVASTSGFVADGYAWLASAAIFNVLQSVILGQVVKIKSVDSGTQLTLYNDVLYDFNVADSASIAPLSTKKNIQFRNVGFIGAQANTQSVLDFDKCQDVLVEGCSFDQCDYVACRISRTINFMASNCSVRRARATGTSYGFAIGNGTYSAKIINCYGEDLRHFVTVGDNDGVNLFVQVANNHVSACQDAGIDAHAACDYMVIDGNTIEGSSFDSGQLDGIIVQGLNCVISNNIIVGARRHNIFHQPIANFGTGSSVISGNQMRNSGGASGTVNAIFVQIGASGSSMTMDGITICNNVISGVADNDINVYALFANAKNVAITGNVVNDASGTYGIFLRAAATYSLEDFAVTGNVLKTNGVANVYCLGTTSPNVLNGVISGNVIIGGTHGIRLTQTQNVVETGNYNTASSKAVFVDTGTSDVWLDRRQSSIVTMTNATYTVVEQDEFLIANRAGTVTITFPSAADWPGREITVKTIQAQTVVSASSNIVPITDSAAGTSILAAVDGAWARLKSDGTNWVVMES